MEDLEFAIALADRLRNWTPAIDDHAFIESVEVVTLDGLVGVDVRWTQITSDQGLRRFGLLMTIREMLDRGFTVPDELDWATGSVILAVQEPHAAPRRDVRKVFRHVP